ncbi:hypothetical protein KSP39_PZI005281 [Platanthera zijinensis]|uniref:Uncharacterized protein n=1 Tax=Platanthera zijinensis TaxID=2320716 RepID=A0AAP0BUE4_9ASPA
MGWRWGGRNGSGRGSMTIALLHFHELFELDIRLEVIFIIRSGEERWFGWWRRWHRNG